MMATKVLFHCEKGHNITFQVPPHTLGIWVVKKGQSEVPENFECEDFENVGFDIKCCSVCNHCIATEVND